MNATVSDTVPADGSSRPQGERALLVDGTAVLIRRLTRLDRDRVADLHRSLPLKDRYLRFFTAGGLAADVVADLVVADSTSRSAPSSATACSGWRTTAARWTARTGNSRSPLRTATTGGVSRRC